MGCVHGRDARGPHARLRKHAVARQGLRGEAQPQARQQPLPRAGIPRPDLPVGPRVVGDGEDPARDQVRTPLGAYAALASGPGLPAGMDHS